MTETSKDQFDGPKVIGTLNGRRWAGRIDCRLTLLEFLREHEGLTGTKRGCEVLACGACTVVLNDRPVSSCGTLAIDLHDSEVWTVEGLAEQGDRRFEALQESFVDEVGFQCGYCTAGQLCLAQTLFVQDDKCDGAPRSTATREWMANNLCRCGSYVGIEAAVNHARGVVS